MGSWPQKRDEPRRIGVGQGLQQHSMNDAEDRGVSSDAKRQSERGNQRDGGVLAERPQCIAEILNEGDHGSWTNSDRNG